MEMIRRMISIISPPIAIGLYIHMSACNIFNTLKTKCRKSIKLYNIHFNCQCSNCQGNAIIAYAKSDEWEKDRAGRSNPCSFRRNVGGTKLGKVNTKLLYYYNCSKVIFLTFYTSKLSCSTNSSGFSSASSSRL